MSRPLLTTVAALSAAVSMSLVATPALAAPAPAPAPNTAPATTPTATASDVNLPGVPASTTGVGAAKLGSTTYPIPAGALHVKAGANAAVGNGRAATPFASIQKAVWNATPGTTIVVHTGVYHEYIGIFNDPRWGTVRDGITLQAAPGAEVWLDGSVELTNWTRSGTTWSAPWADDPNFNTIAGFGGRDEVGDLAFAGPQNPLAADSSQVFLGGVQLTQVAADPGPGQFAVDRTDPANKRIVLGQDPAGHQVRASKLHQAIVSNANDVVLKGFGVRGYATPLNWMGTVYLEGRRPIVENLVLDSLPTVPLNLSSATGGVVRHVTAANAGLSGLGAHHADNSLFEKNYVVGANQQRFNAAPVAAGVKITQQRDFAFRDNEIVATSGATGLWIDESNVNFTLTGNRIAQSGSNGIHVEISACTVIADNTVIDSAGSGLEILGTPHVWVANNHLARNGARGAANISVLQDGRRQTDGGMGIDSRHPGADPLNTWITTDVRIVNNVLGAPAPGALGQFDVHDRVGRSYADLMLEQVEGNILVDTSAQKFARLGTPGHTSRTYADLAGVRAAHPQDWLTNVVLGTNRSDAELTWFAAAQRGVALPENVASLIGVPAGSTAVGPR